MMFPAEIPDLGFRHVSRRVMVTDSGESSTTEAAPVTLESDACAEIAPDETVTNDVEVPDIPALGSCAVNDLPDWAL